MTLALRACPRCKEGAVQTEPAGSGYVECVCLTCGCRGTTRVGQGHHHQHLPTAESARRVNESRERAADKRRGNPEREQRHKDGERAWAKCLACRHNDLTLEAVPGAQDSIRCDRRIHTTYVGLGGLKMPNSKARLAILACERYEERGA